MAWRFGSDAAYRKKCHYDAVPTVEVITAPTDWAAVVSAAVTGVAAIAGIAGTSWLAASARKEAASAREAASRDLQASIKAAADNLEISNAAEDRRAIQTQKMRIYAAFQGAVDDVIAVARRSKQQEGEFSKAHSAMLKAAAEAVLVAPKVIGDLADRITRYVSDNIGPSGFRSNVDPQQTIDRHRKELTKEMKADLATYETRPAPAELPPQSSEAKAHPAHM